MTRARSHVSVPAGHPDFDFIALRNQLVKNWRHGQRTVTRRGPMLMDGRRVHRPKRRCK